MSQTFPLHGLNPKNSIVMTLRNHWNFSGRISDVSNGKRIKGIKCGVCLHRVIVWTDSVSCVTEIPSFNDTQTQFLSTKERVKRTIEASVMWAIDYMNSDFSETKWPVSDVEVTCSLRDGQWRGGGEGVGQFQSKNCWGKTCKGSHGEK